MTRMPALNASNGEAGWYCFPGVVALKDVSMRIGRGKGHVLLGENGAGKSNLINLLGGVFRPDDGNILFDGKQ
ncbi:ATP-binding cassette domain-containing protein, partial [Rhizobium ruizarguesonis]